MKFAVLQFPGSNCDQDVVHVLLIVLGHSAELLWHKEPSLGAAEAVIVPGGFSYGDYLRTGAIARFSPALKAVAAHASAGGLVIGICNGFQILCEAGLLPGALLRNESLTFVCRYVNVRVENASTMFTSGCRKGEVLEIPIAHGEGNYFADDDTIKGLEDGGQVLFRYAEKDGRITAAANPNGSRGNIAGIMNRAGNVMGMMPHPERASDPLLRHTDGQKIFRSLVGHFTGQEHHSAVTLEERD
jgi:phosphoribosylformylglycinamidine synthase I